LLKESFFIIWLITGDGVQVKQNINVNCHDTFKKVVVTKTVLNEKEKLVERIFYKDVEVLAYQCF